ncbi:MAG: hypothetical protein ACRD0G_09230 [Acidimicrobiales bacterium]
MTELRPDGRVTGRDLLPSVLIVLATLVLAVILTGDAVSSILATVVVTAPAAAAALGTWARTAPSIRIEADQLVIGRRRHDDMRVAREPTGAVWIDSERLALVGGDVLRVAVGDEVPADPAQPLVPWHGSRLTSVSWYDHEQLRDALVQAGWPVRAGMTPSQLRRSQRDATRWRPR